MTHQATTSANAVDLWDPDAVYAFADGWNQAHALAKKCRAQLGQFDVHRFPDGETLVSAAPSDGVSGRTVAIYRSLYDPNAKLVEVMLAANALRSLGAAKVILIAPYLPYMRQDRAFQPGQAISQEAVGQLLATLFDGIITIQPHLHRTLALSNIFGNTPAIAIKAGHAIAADLRAAGDHSDIIVGPDEESEGLVREVVDDIGASWFVARKARHGDNDVTIEMPPGLEIRGKSVVIVDDIVSSGGTVISLAKKLKAAGAGDITVYAVHALFDQRAALLMERAGVSMIKSFSTVPHTTNAVPIVDLICSGLGVN